MITLSDYGYNILQIETYGLCNMACGFCPYPLKEEKDKSSKLDDGIIKNIIDQLNPKDRGFNYITFSQFNEPLLDSRIFDYVKYAKDKGFEVYFITNGLLLNKEKNIEKLIELNPVVKISLQILDTSAHKLKRGINIEFERYSETILNFIQKTAKTKLQVIIDVGSNFNDNKVKYFVKNLFGLSVGDPNLPNTYNDTLDILKSFLVKNNINLTEKHILNLINSDYAKQSGIQVSDNVKIKIKNFHYGNRLKDFFPINDNFKCDTSILSVQSTGEVVPCCLTYDASLSLGQIKKSSLLEILNNNSFLKNLRTKGLKKNIVCKKCYGEPTKRGAFLRNIINLIK